MKETINNIKNQVTQEVVTYLNDEIMSKGLDTKNKYQMAKINTLLAGINEIFDKSSNESNEEIKNENEEESE